jgi:hypothetical protein
MDLIEKGIALGIAVVLAGILMAGLTPAFRTLVENISAIISGA